MSTFAEAKAVLEAQQVIAVLGAHIEPSKPAHYVPKYLYEQGYEVHPVNPSFAGETLWGKTVVSTLADLTDTIHVVDVFRKAEHLPTHLQDFLSMAPQPPVVWFQSGIREDSIARVLQDVGITVIQDRCMLADHMQL